MEHILKWVRMCETWKLTPKSIDFISLIPVSLSENTDRPLGLLWRVKYMTVFYSSLKGPLQPPYSFHRVTGMLTSVSSHCFPMAGEKCQERQNGKGRKSRAGGSASHTAGRLLFCLQASCSLQDPTRWPLEGWRPSTSQLPSISGWSRSVCKGSRGVCLG